MLSHVSKRKKHRLHCNSGQGGSWCMPTLSTSEPNTQAGEPGHQHNGADC